MPTERPQSFYKEDDPLEKVIEAKVKKRARDNGWLTYKWVSPNNRGVLDDIMINPETEEVWFVEFKRKGKTWTAKQADVRDDLIAAGQKTKLIDSIEEGYKFFK